QARQRGPGEIEVLEIGAREIEAVERLARAKPREDRGPEPGGRFWLGRRRGRGGRGGGRGRGYGGGRGRGRGGGRGCGRGRGGGRGRGRGGGRGGFLGRRQIRRRGRLLVFDRLGSGGRRRDERRSRQRGRGSPAHVERRAGDFHRGTLRLGPGRGQGKGRDRLLRQRVHLVLAQHRGPL